MKKNNYKLLINENRKLQCNILFFILGILIMIISAIFYYYSYLPFSECIIKIQKADFSSLIIMWICSISFLVGLMMFISCWNLRNKIVSIALAFILGVFSVFLFMSERIAVAFVLLVISILIFIITKIMEKVFCTFASFLLGACFFPGIFYGLIKLICMGFRFDTYIQVEIYLSVSMYFLLYNIFGCKINRIFLIVMFGHNKESAAAVYGYEQLKNQINLMYLISFIIINICFMFDNNDAIRELASIINNALLTGVCISNVKWNSIF